MIAAHRSSAADGSASAATASSSVANPTDNGSRRASKRSASDSGTIR